MKQSHRTKDSSLLHDSSELFKGKASDLSTGNCPGSRFSHSYPLCVQSFFTQSDSLHVTPNKLTRPNIFLEQGAVTFSSYTVVSTWLFLQSKWQKFCISFLCPSDSPLLPLLFTASWNFCHLLDPKFSFTSFPCWKILPRCSHKAKQWHKSKGHLSGSWKQHE